MGVNKVDRSEKSLYVGLKVMMTDRNIGRQSQRIDRKGMDRETDWLSY